MSKSEGESSKPSFREMMKVAGRKLKTLTTRPSRQFASADDQHSTRRSRLGDPAELTVPAAADSLTPSEYPVAFSRLPAELKLVILEEAASDTSTAYSLTLVSRAVRQRIEPLLYSSVILDTKEKIRYFALYTIPAKLDIHPHPDLPATLQPEEAAAIASATITAVTAASSTFFDAVHILTLVVDEEHFRILYPDILTCARTILITCKKVASLEISGDFLRPTPDGPPWPSSQLSLSHALMRPKYLTLVPPHNTVDFTLRILEQVTHLQYAKVPPRHLGYRRFYVTEGGTSFESGCKRVQYVAFDYQLGNEGSSPATFVGMIKEALSPLRPVEEQSQNNTEEGDSDDHEAATPEPIELPYVQSLERVVVRVVLRPQKSASLSMFHTIWPRLDAMRKSDARLVYFAAKWKDNEVFGDDIWEKAKEVLEERTGGRRTFGRESRSWSFSTITSGNGGSGSVSGRRRRSTSLTLSWYQDT